MSERLNLSGRVAVITGASRGIGAAVADALAAHGMHLILNSQSVPETLEARAHALASVHGVGVETCVGNIADPSTSAELAKRAFARHRRLDVWVNNAGVMLDALIGMIPPAHIDTTLAVNVAGVLHGIQQAARVMGRCGGGSIVNLTSIMGRFGNVGQMVYASSKAAVVGATLAAAKELAPKNIRVNAVAPGVIDTDLLKGLTPEQRAEKLARIGMGRIGTPEDVAECVLFLASDLSRYVTGQVIGVDGGMVV